MRRSRRIVSLVLVLVTVVAAGLAPAWASARQYEGEWGEGLTIEPVREGEGEGALDAFGVWFAPHSFVPEVEYAAAMIVKVQQGTFAFRAQNEVVIDPQGDYLAVLMAMPRIQFGQTPAAVDQQYLPTAMTVPGCLGTPPTVLCVVGESVLGEGYVRLEPGDLVYLPENSTCFFCNTTPLEAEAQLLVWSQATAFQQRSMTGTPTPASPVALDPSVSHGWMRLNPGSPCN
jgi:hypothetical protein